MKLKISLALAMTYTLIMSGCGGASTNNTVGTIPTETTHVGYLVDSAVSGADYYGDHGSTGVTDENGAFLFHAGESITFKLGDYPLGSVALDAENDNIILTPIDLINGEVVQNADSSIDDARLDVLLQLLQTADDNANPEDGIAISNATKAIISDTLQTQTSTQDAASVATALSRDLVSVADARSHFEASLKHSHDESSRSSSLKARSSSSSQRSSSSVSYTTSSSADSTSSDSNSNDEEHNTYSSSSSSKGYSSSSRSSSSSIGSSSSTSHHDDDEHDSHDSHDDEHDSHDSSSSNGNSSSASNNSSSSNGGASSSAAPMTGEYTLLAWNDLGMHCMDGKDFSVFTILPPYNTLNAQLIKKAGTSNKHITSGVTLTYSAAASLDGKYNTTSMLDNNNNPKTNFWDYVGSLFNTTLPSDTGLTGNMMTELTTHTLSYNAGENWWEATGIPLTPYNDDGSKNYYPMVHVTATDSSGAVLATTQVVLPVSDEMDCKVCHGSTSGYTSGRPSAGWENLADVEQDFKYNVLRLHDQEHPSAVSDHQTALKAAGYDNYDDAGLYTTAKNGNPILCATCHASNALAGTGIAGIKPLTEALHGLHADVIDPTTNQTLSSASNRNACYRCHPGESTQCLRGAMGKISDIQCQSCHGNMQAVGTHGRNGWLSEPNCQSCHQDGQRHKEAVTNANTGTLRAALDTRFATNANTPANGVSLYRFSAGHGDMQCSSCHGATHAIYPSAHAEDNLQSIAVQGYEGTIAECTACHDTVPKTTSGGPHGMHSADASWVKDHQSAAERNPTQCQSCHGTDYRGTVLSKMFTTRTLDKKQFAAGKQVGCYDCHNGPSGD